MNNGVKHQFRFKPFLLSLISVLNREDPEWFWIVRSDGQEGFIPSGFVYPADNVLQNNAKTIAQNNDVNQQSDAQQLQHQTTEAMINNDNNNSLNLPVGPAIGNMTVQNNNAINAQSASIGNNGNNNTSNSNSQVQTAQQQQQSIVGGSDDLRYHGTELVMLYDYKVCRTFFKAQIMNVIFENVSFPSVSNFRHKHPTTCPYDVAIGSMLI